MTSSGTGNGKPRQVKCVVWDLDGTLWDGVLLEDADVVTRDSVIAIIRALDEVGILHSISSKNDHNVAMRRLQEPGSRIISFIRRSTGIQNPTRYRTSRSR